MDYIYTFDRALNETEMGSVFNYKTTYLCLVETEQNTVNVEVFPNPITRFIQIKSDIECI